MTFREQRTKYKLTTVDKVRKFLTGKTCKVVSWSGGHNYPSTFKVMRSPYISGVSSYNNLTGINQNTISENEFYVISSSTKEELEVEKTTLTKEYNETLKELDNKLEFIKLSGAEEYDENAFKAYSVLQVIKNESDDFKKAKLIAELIG